MGGIKIHVLSITVEFRKVTEITTLFTATVTSILKMKKDHLCVYVLNSNISWLNQHQNSNNFLKYFKLLQLGKKLIQSTNMNKKRMHHMAEYFFFSSGINNSNNYKCGAEKMQVCIFQ